MIERTHKSAEIGPNDPGWTPPPAVLNLLRRARQLQNCPSEPGMLRLAVELCRKAVGIAPDNADIADSLAQALRLDGDIEESSRVYDRFLVMHPEAIEIRLARLFGTLPLTYESEDHLARVRAEYEHMLHELEFHLEEAPPATCRRLMAQGRSFYPYYLAYQDLNDAPLQARLGVALHRAMLTAHPELMGEVNHPSTDGRPRIGFVSNQFYSHTIWQAITRGWLTGLAERGFACFGYAPANKRNDACTALSRSHCISFHEGERSFTEWARLIRADRLDAIIYPSLGYSRIIDKLALLRLAPVQCLTAGHWETSGFPNMDYFISSDLMEPPDGDSHYTERLIRLPDIGLSYLDHPVTPSPLRRGDFGLGTEDLLYVSPHLPHKYLPWHDDLYARIAASSSKAKLLFFRAPIGERASRLFERRLHGAFAAAGARLLERLVFLDRLPSHEYRALLAQVDVYLDVPGWGGGTTTAEAIGLGLPVVTLEGRTARSRMGAAMLRHLGIPALIADTLDNYVNLAVRMGRDKDWRLAVGQDISTSKHRLYADTVRLNNLATFLLAASRENPLPELHSANLA